MADPSKDGFNSSAMPTIDSVRASNPEEDGCTTSPPAASPEDLHQIWAWNGSVPNQIRGSIHDQITFHAEHQPNAPAVCAWDGNFTYSELDAIATKVARKLIIQQHGIAPKSSIPLLFSKSKWTPVAMLAVLKAGCSAIALDATQPDGRLKSIVEQVVARPGRGLVISSERHRERAVSLVASVDLEVLQLDDVVLEEDGAEEGHLSELPLPVVPPDDIAYISFTSYVVPSSCTSGHHKTDKIAQRNNGPTQRCLHQPRQRPKRFSLPGRQVGLYPKNPCPGLCPLLVRRCMGQLSSYTLCGRDAVYPVRGGHVDGSLGGGDGLQRDLDQRHSHGLAHHPSYPRMSGDGSLERRDAVSREHHEMGW